MSLSAFLRGATLCLLAAICCEISFGQSGTSLEDAEALYRNEGPEAALPLFESLAAGFKVENRRVEEATAIHFLGECYWRLGDFDQSRQFLDQALAMRMDLGDQLGIGKTRNVLGLLEWDLGNYSQAIDRFREASSAGVASGDVRLQGATLNNLSLVYDELGKYHQSLAQYRDVLDIYAGADFPRGEGDTYGNIGGVYLLLGRFREALDNYRLALTISEELQSRPAISQDTGNIGLALLGVGDVDAAIDAFDQAISIAGEMGMRQDVAWWRGAKANALIQKGRPDLGLELHRQALAEYRNLGARAELLAALHDMGQLHLSLGDPATARENFEDAITLARTINHDSGITTNLIALGKLQLRMEDFEAARAYFGQAAARAEATDARSHQIQALLGLAYAAQATADFEESSQSLESALAIAVDTEARQDEAEIRFARGEQARLQGEFDEALDELRKAEALLLETGDPDLLWQIRYSVGRVEEARGRLEAAAVAMTQAVERIEGVRARLAEERFRAGYLQDKHQVYVDLVRLQLELNRPKAAFRTAERLRAQSYRRLYDQGVTVTLDPAEQRHETALRERIRQLQRALGEERENANKRQAAINTFSSELLVAQRKYEALLDDRRSRSFTNDVSGRIPDVASVRRRLDDGELLVEYVVGRDLLMLFAINRDGLFTASNALSRDNLRSRVELLRDLIGRPVDDRWKKPANSLSEVLVAPLTDLGLLEDTHTLYVVPHGYLNYVPFSVLASESGGGLSPLLDRMTVIYLPTAAVLADPAVNRTNDISLLAVAPGNSRLQFAPDEAASVNRLYAPNSRLLVGDMATESRFKEMANRYQILHVATHSEFNRLNPMFSALHLEPDDQNDGRLEVHEVLRLQLSADLVTLSACDTGLGSGFFTDVPAGDEFVGLTRAFLSVGTNNVIASLWEVDDRSSVELMTRFYRTLRQTDSSKQDALLAAQRILRQTKDYEHPYYWAPFVLFGRMGAKSEISETPL